MKVSNINIRLIINSNTNVMIKEFLVTKGLFNTSAIKKIN